MTSEPSTPVRDAGVQVAVEPPEPTPAPEKAIEGRSLGRIAWTRLKRDKVAMAGGVVVILLVLVAIFAPVIVKFLGYPPNDILDPKLINPDLGIPRGRFGGISTKNLLGVEPQNPRDIFSRIVYGARISLLVAFCATAVAVIMGTVLGIVAGYMGGIIDAAISRTMDLLLAFPQLLFTIALISVIPPKIAGLSGSGERIVVLIFVIGFFGWPYIGRIVRGQALSLREREFIEASRSLGAKSSYVIFRELLPNLIAPILVYSTLIIPTNILQEAALSFLGVGVEPPTASWGQMINAALGWFRADPTYLIVPGMAIFITVLAFNLFGDGLRDALDPKASR